MTVQPGLCRTWSEQTLLVFSSIGSYFIYLYYNLSSNFEIQGEDDLPSLSSVGEVTGESGGVEGIDGV